jgi:hypothetical protein
MCEAPDVLGEQVLRFHLLPQVPKDVQVLADTLSAGDVKPIAEKRDEVLRRIADQCKALSDDEVRGTPQNRVEEMAVQRLSDQRHSPQDVLTAVRRVLKDLKLSSDDQVFLAHLNGFESLHRAGLRPRELAAGAEQLRRRLVALVRNVLQADAQRHRVDTPRAS